MRSRLDILIDLLHSQGEGALATHSLAVPGYPFATAVPFALDANHRPMLLLSALAEHTRNLAADAKASFLLARSLGEGEMARVPLVGDVQPIAAEPQLVRRYLRFHPEAERFLQLGDFRFHRFEPRRMLVVGGFAQAGWMEGHRLIEGPHIPIETEADIIAATQPDLPAGIELLGVDAFGADYRDGGMRRRLAFAGAPVVVDALPATLLRELGQ